MASQRYIRAVNRMIGRHGEAVTVTNFTEGTTDAHGDPERVVDTQETVIAIVTREGISNTLSEVLPAGRDDVADATLWFTPASARTEPIHGPDDTPTAFVTRLTRDATGAEFDVERKWVAETGHVRVFGTEV